MAGVIPIPSSRVSGYLLRTRLTQQFQKDQLDLFRLQEQIATGQRIVLPSDDAPAALRAISLRRLIERKEQITSNVRIGQQYLAASDTALQDVATQLANLKGSTLGVAGTITSEEQRQTALEEINGYLENLVNIANRQYQGRYLFSGSLTSQQPYSLVDGNVVYNGDAGQVQNYSDFGVLFSSSISGQEVFGGTSAQVEGTVDLNPQLGLNTSLSSLRQGRGIASNGALQISDGTNISIVDISGARTIGDVVRQIQENPPTGREVKVSVTPTGLTLQITGGPSGANLSVQEVGNGTAARELGILNIAGVGTSPLAGEDLDPQLLKTTRLEDLLGAKARTTIQSANRSSTVARDPVWRPLLTSVSNSARAFFASRSSLRICSMSTATRLYDACTAFHIGIDGRPFTPDTCDGSMMPDASPNNAPSPCAPAPAVARSMNGLTCISPLDASPSSPLVGAAPPAACLAPLRVVAVLRRHTAKMLAERWLSTTMRVNPYPCSRTSVPVDSACSRIPIRASPCAPRAVRRTHCSRSLRAPP